MQAPMAYPALALIRIELPAAPDCAGSLAPAWHQEVLESMRQRLTAGTVKVIFAADSFSN